MSYKFSALCAAFFVASVASADATTLDYIFTGTGTGTLGGTSFNGGFTVSLIGDTNDIVFTSQYNVPVTGTFSTGGATATFGGLSNTVISNTSPSIGFIGFGQVYSTPGGIGVGAEAVFGTPFIGYDLSTIFPETSADVSFAVQTFVTSLGDLTFTSISSLSFQAVAVGAVPLPATWAMMLGGLAAFGIAARRRMMKS